MDFILELTEMWGVGNSTPRSNGSTERSNSSTLRSNSSTPRSNISLKSNYSTLPLRSNAGTLRSNNVVGNTATIRSSNSMRRNQVGFWKEELECEEQRLEEQGALQQLEHLQEEQKRQTLARKWYLIVIVLLYVGLLASFSLNVSLLLRRHYVQIPAEITDETKILTSSHEDYLKEDHSYGHTVPNNSGVAAVPPAGGAMSSDNIGMSLKHGFTYTTPCLVSVPCESGSYYDCGSGLCQECPRGSYQPQWGQTSCWPCPDNTTTDNTGEQNLQSCKRHDCPFYAGEGVGILESPNYPGHYPVGVECRWRVRPGHTRRVLVIVSHLSLAADCTDTLTIRRSDHPKTGTVFHTCSSRQQPLVITGHSKNIWVDFSSTGQSSAAGFQLTAISVEEELGYLVDAIVNEGEIASFDNTDSDDGSLNQEDKLLLSRLLLLLNPGYTNTQDTSQRKTVRRKKPVIEVLEEHH